MQRRHYDPAPLHAVPALALSAAGVTGVEGSGATVADAHHRDHPAGKFNGDNGISILFTAHYAAMRARFGDHLTDGIAGESILVETGESIEPEEAYTGFTIHTADGRTARLEGLRVAEPCVEFTHFSLCCPPDSRSDRRVTEALDFLRGGRRGFYARFSGEPVTVRLGDTVSSGAG